MSVDLTGPQDTFTTFFHTLTLRVTREEVDFTSPCSLSAAGGDTQRSEGVDREVGDFIVELPARSTLVLIPGEWFEIDERPGYRYRVVWAPGPDSFNLGVMYEVKRNR